MNPHYKSNIEGKNLLILPVDLSTMFNVDGTLNTRLMKRKARMNISKSSPIINHTITEGANKNVLTVTGELSKTYTKATILANGKNVFVEAEFTSEEINAISNVAELTELINSKNNLVFITSVVSIFSEAVIDIYYSKSEGCLIVTPELTILGNVLPANEFLLDVSGYKVAPLMLDQLQTDINFKADVKYRPIANTVLDHPVGAIAEAKSDSQVYSILLQGLATQAYISEYMRHTNNGDVNMLKDTPIQIVRLSEPTLSLFGKDVFDHHFVVHTTPVTYKLQQINNVKCEYITFPIFF